MTDIQGLLGDEADDLLTHVSKGIPKEDLTLPGPDFVDRVLQGQRPLAAGAAQPRSAVRPRPPGRHRLRVDPAGRPGHRALGRGVVRAQPDVLRPDEHRRAGHRGRLQRRGHHLRRARRRARASTPTSIPFIVKLNHNELLTYPNKFDQVMFGIGGAGLRPGRGRRWAPRSTSAPTESHRQIAGGRPRPSPQAHELGMFTVLWCYLRNTAFKVDGVDYHAVGRPDRPGQPPRRDHRGRHHQAEAAREQRRLQRAARLRQDQPSWSTASWPPTTRSTWPAGRWRTATWAASG